MNVKRGEFRRLDGKKKPLKAGEAFELKFGDRTVQFRPVKNFSKETKHAQA